MAGGCKVVESRVKGRRKMMVFMPLVVVWIGQICRDVIGRQNVKVALQLALECIETATKRYTTKVPLTTQDIMELLTLCLNSSYFQYNGKH